MFKNGQSSDTGNIEHKTNNEYIKKQKNTRHKDKRWPTRTLRTKKLGWTQMLYWSRTNYRQVPVIANLHGTRERTRIFGPFLADDNNKWWQCRRQNPTFVSWLIQKKSDKTPLETIPLYINLAGRSLLIYIYISLHITRWR